MSFDADFLRTSVSSGEAGAGLARLWEAVRVRLSGEDGGALGRIHVGKIGSDPAAFPWAHTNEGEELVNLTLELKPAQLELNLVGWKEAQADALKGWLQTVEGEDTVAALDGYEVIAFARHAYKKTPASRPWWQDESVEELGVCPASRFNAGWIVKHMIGLGSRSEVKPAFHVRRSWPRAHAAEMGDALPDVIAAEVHRLLPVLQRIREMTSPRGW